MLARRSRPRPTRRSIKHSPSWARQALPAETRLELESLMSRVRTKEDQHEARAQALVGVVAGLSSQVADQLIGDQAGGPVEQLINTLGNSGFRSAARGQAEGAWKAALSHLKGLRK